MQHRAGAACTASRHVHTAAPACVSGVAALDRGFARTAPRRLSLSGTLPAPRRHAPQVPVAAATAFVLLGVEEIGVYIEEPFSILPLEHLVARLDSVRVQGQGSAMGSRTVGAPGRHLRFRGSWFQEPAGYTLDAPQAPKSLHACSRAAAEVRALH